MFSTNTYHKLLSYQAKTNNNRDNNSSLSQEKNSNISPNKEIKKAVNNHAPRFAKVKLKKEGTSLASTTSIDSPSNLIMLSAVYRICIICLLETLRLIRGTLKQMDHRDSRKEYLRTSDSINSDGASSPISLKRERTVRRKKYTTAPKNSSSSNGIISSSNNVCYVRTKVDPGLLRQRVDKHNQEKLRTLKLESYMRNDHDGKIDLPKRARSITYPGDNGKSTTIKVLSATKAPQSCCLRSPAQNYAVLMSAMNGSVKTFDQFLMHASKNLGRGNRKRSSIPSANMFSSRNSSTYRRRSLEVVLEEDE